MFRLDQYNLFSPERSLFKSKIVAGFECGIVHRGKHDLLRTTRHLAGDRMREHFRIAIDHGILVARDGLVPGHDTVERLRAARETGMQVIWDLSHYHHVEDAAAYSRSIALQALAVDGSEKLWLCPVNEPSLYPMLAGLSREHAVAMAVQMTRAALDAHPNVGILVNDPITGVGDRQYEATDAIVSAVPVDVIGVNYYPHTARTALSKVLLKTWRRYCKPIMVSETSWHDGHPVHHRRHPGFHKGMWMRHVLDEVNTAGERGADIVGVCWYPMVDCPPWHAPRSRRRWSHGLIRQDLSVDAALSGELRFMLYRQAA
ncbi:glycosyl hydrolase 53 family protein [Pararhizobium gei]|uniref:glycosyl hydrolase 53 family protein n=1 Tax=Pararhizobium gei TaxID=1395951 RepID=UPI0023DC0E23|nr:glycosyl hydrolase 53 family protein [Rhizobium gei]